MLRVRSQLDKTEQAPVLYGCMSRGKDVLHNNRPYGQLVEVENYNSGLLAKSPRSCSTSSSRESSSGMRESKEKIEVLQLFAKLCAAAAACGLSKLIWDSALKVSFCS
eukprot:2964601-Pleurochrysis_carterae.AAC.2